MKDALFKVWVNHTLNEREIIVLKTANLVLTRTLSLTLRPRQFVTRNLLCPGGQLKLPVYERTSSDFGRLHTT